MIPNLTTCAYVKKNRLGSKNHQLDLESNNYCWWNSEIRQSPPGMKEKKKLAFK